MRGCFVSRTLATLLNKTGLPPRQVTKVGRSPAETSSAPRLFLMSSVEGLWWAQCLLLVLDAKLKPARISVEVLDELRDQRNHAVLSRAVSCDADLDRELWVPFGLCTKYRLCEQPWRTEGFVPLHTLC